MIITEAVIHDGYIERQLMFISESAPIMKLRAVRGADGKYQPIVRDYATGVALAIGNIPSYTNPQDCLRAAQNIAINFITENIERVVPL
jgi:hypothetical protein